MARIAAVLRLVLLLLTAAIGSAAADTLSLPGLDGDARAYANVLTAKSPPTLNQKLVDEALAAASQALAAKDFAKAIQGFERAIANRDDRPALWSALAEAQAALTPPNLARALQAGWLAAYKAKPNSNEQIAATMWVARLLEGPLKRPEDARTAYRAALSQAMEAHLPLPEAKAKMD